MIRHLLGLLCISSLLLSPDFAAGQLFYNDGADVTVESGAVVEVQGDLTNTNNGQIDNSGKIFVSGDWTNNVSNGALTPTTGRVILDGGAQNIAGTDSTTFHEIIIQGTGDKTVTAIGVGNTGIVVTDSLALDNNALELNQRTLQVTNSNTDAITRNNGHIISETTDGVPPNTNFSQVQWDVGSNTGSYTFPFGTYSSVYIPLTYNITSGGSAGGSLVMSTYPTAWDNTPYADDSTVTNMQIDGYNDKPAEVVNRFWRIDLRTYTTKPTADITFSWEDNADLCKDAGCASTLAESDLVAQRWRANSNTWELPYFSGTVNTVNNTLNITNVSESFSWWTLSNNCATLFAGAGTDQSICPGDTIPLNTIANGGDGSYSYSWSPNTGLSCSNCPNPNAYPSSTTSYELTITDGQSCVDKDTITITVAASPITSASPDTSVCQGDSVTLSVSGGTSYAWSPSTGLACDTCSTTSASPSTSTTYNVSVTNGSCTDDTTISVSVNPTPTAGVTNDSFNICETDTAQLQASGGTNYTWSPAIGLSCTNCASPQASPNTTTTYTVVVGNGSGCTDDTSVIVTVDSAPVAKITPPDTTICDNDSIQLQASGGTSFTWSPSTGLSCTNCPDPKASPSSNTTYTVTVSTAAGCTDDSSITISTLAAPTASVNTDTTSICSGSDTALLIASGGTNYAWSPSGSLGCSTCDTTQAFPSSTTTYTVTVTNTNGCDDTAVTTVAVGSPPTVVIDKDSATICAGDSATLDASGSAGASFTWTPSNGLGCVSCPITKASPSSTTTYTVTVGDAAGCTNDTNITVVVNPNPSLVASPDTAICQGDSAQLNATSSGSVNYTWSGSGLSCTNCQSTTASPTSSSTYIVTVVDTSTGCSQQDSIQVAVLSPAGVGVIPNEDSICVGDTAHLQAVGGLNYQWSPSSSLTNPNSAATDAYPTTTTTYTVTSNDSVCTNRTDSATVKVTVLPLPNIGANPDTTIDLGNSVTLHANGGGIYSWTPGNSLDDSTTSDPVASPETTTDYVVMVTSNQGCMNADTVTVEVNDEIDLYIPNTITPNGDGINDSWYIDGLQLYNTVKIEIYNRWGNMVHEDENYNNDWKGTRNGSKLPSATYYYILHLDDNEPITGTITIIR